MFSIMTFQPQNAYDQSLILSELGTRLQEICGALSILSHTLGQELSIACHCRRDSAWQSPNPSTGGGFVVSLYSNDSSVQPDFPIRK